MSDPRKLHLTEPWPTFLARLDEQLTEKVTLHCFGGFVLTSLYGISRRTEDIDYLSAAPRGADQGLMERGGMGSALAKEYRVYMQRVGIADLREDYEDRLVKMELDLKNLTLLAVDPYDLILAKLTANRSVDREDVRALAAKMELTFSVIEERFEKEMKPWLPNLARHELTLKLWKEYFAK
jgi:hypothetical protein